MVSFTLTFSIFIILSAGLIAYFKDNDNTQLKQREGFVLTIVSWASISLLSCLPFFLLMPEASFTDSMFESVSNLTATGLSVVPTADYSLTSVRMWKNLLQWVGGFGLILMVMTLFPAMKIGGTQLMFTEFSDRSEKIMPYASQIAKALLFIYAGFTVVLTILLWAGSMSFMDSLHYSMSAISTGGGAIADQTADMLSPYSKIVLSLGMLVGGSTLMLFIKTFQGDWFAYLKDEQTKCFYLIISIAAVIVFFQLWGTDQTPASSSLFLVISTITTTGFNISYRYDNVLQFLLLILSVLGGCSGSTTGGIKIFRIQIIYRLTKNQLLQLLKPFGIFPTLYNRTEVTESILSGILMAVFLHIAGLLAVAFGLVCYGSGIWYSFSLSATLTSNCGTFMGEYAEHLQTLCTEAKWICVIAMLMGRFEFVTFVVVCMMPFWRR
ncbi:TrkH family potassium uptake protein [Candidatus Hydrogenosomobacter endosymbioticus]|nr:potassium transporter TrkG [Candidatus Hydrogenosomobacter endosymbioticus]